MKLLVPLLCAVSVSATLHAQTGDAFAAYEHCRFPDELSLVQASPLADGVEGRTVKTVMGNKNVPLAGGARLLYAYPQTEPFANVKVERIPADSYKQAKQDLIANFEQILTADDSSARNYAMKPRVNGLEIYGLDKKKIEGTTIGMYLFFADRTHTATTIYFLNADADARRFSSLEEYAKLRDGFVQTMTACAAGHAAVPAKERASSAERTVHADPKPAAEPPATKASHASESTAKSATGAAYAAVPEGSANAKSAATPSDDSYVPPEAAPLVHPRNGADRKATTKITKTKSSGDRQPNE